MKDLVAKQILPTLVEIAKFAKENKSEDRGKTYFST